MSFSVRCDDEDLEYNGTSINYLFAQRRNLFRPAFLRMIRGIMAFNKDCKDLLTKPAVATTLGEFVKTRGYSREFVDWYIRPMAAAVWSIGTVGILEMPIYFLARFFENHGFLNIEDRPQWYTIEGGSRTYANAVAKLLGSRLRLSTPVSSIERSGQTVTIKTNQGESLVFDQVIIAAHSTAALKMLSDPTPAEQHILGDIWWSQNQVTMHTDESILPKRKLAWAAWNYHLFGSKQTTGKEAAVTYHMNLLQGLNAQESILVSLNCHDMIDPKKVIKTIEYEHPIFDKASTAAQERWHEISGTRSRTQFAGAYWFNGFHEDGVVSALRAARAVDPEVGL
jgi:predicted NAD/FAD-binding protein